MATALVAWVDKVTSRVRRHLWGVVQQTAAASLAWLLAAQLAGELAEDHRPFFAPIAAIVALNSTLGSRGLQAVRLFEGAAVGVIVGGIALSVLESSGAALPVATFIAMMLAVCVGAARVTIAQAASGAILTVAIPYGGSGGPTRLMDAAIGVAVALVFSQVLFPTHPLRMLQRSEQALIEQMLRLLRRSSEALSRTDDDDADDAGRPGTDSGLREAQAATRDAIADLEFARSASRNIVRRTAWARLARLRGNTRARSAADALIEDAATAGLLVSMTVPAASPASRAGLANVLTEIADVLFVLEGDAQSPAGRAYVAEQAQQLHDDVSRARHQPDDGDPTTDAAIGSVHILLNALQRLHPGDPPGGPANPSPGATASGA